MLRNQRLNLACSFFSALIAFGLGLLMSAVPAGCDSHSNMAYSAASRASYAGLVSLPAEGEPPDSDIDEEFNTESYDVIYENPFFDPKQTPLSTFAADVDTASYSNIRRFINSGQWPVPGAVRIEEMVNYFTYDYELPESRTMPFAANVEITDCPWNVGHRLAAIGIKAWDVETEERPPANLVFLIDVSGSMEPDNKLPLLKRGMAMLARDVRPDDRIGIVTYASSAGVRLRSTSGKDRQRILNAIDTLEAGGSTNGQDGLRLAYDMAEVNSIEGGINRIIMATDGDFNTGTTSQSELVRFVENRAREGVYITVLGFGMGNYKDSMLEKLADHGNGNFAYIDTIHEARRMLVDHIGSTLMTVAKDVKLQVEFNPAEVAGYRLIGYENRLMEAQEFYEDDKDAGEIGAGHSVTALYEIIPVGASNGVPRINDLKYQSDRQLNQTARTSGELFTVRIRYKDPDTDAGDEIEVVAVDHDKVIDECSDTLRFAAAVAEFGLLLRDSRYKGNASFDQVLGLARGARGEDPYGERNEFIQLAISARSLEPEDRERHEEEQIARQ